MQTTTLNTENYIHHLEWSPDGKTLLYNRPDAWQIGLFDISTKKMADFMDPVMGPPYRLSGDIPTWHPSGDGFFYGHGATLRFYNVQDRLEKDVLKNTSQQGGHIDSIAASPDGNLTAVVQVIGSDHARLFIIDNATFTYKELLDLNNRINDVSWNGSHQLIYQDGKSRSIGSIDIKTEEKSMLVKEGSRPLVNFPYGLISYTSEEGKKKRNIILNLMDIRSGKTKSFSLKGGSEFSYYPEPSWSPDGLKLALVISDYSFFGQKFSTKLNVFRVDKNAFLPVEDAPATGRASWSSDSKSFVYAGPGSSKATYSKEKSGYIFSPPPSLVFVDLEA